MLTGSASERDNDRDREGEGLNRYVCACISSGLRQVLVDVMEEMRHSISPDIDGAEVLHGLLCAPWLQSLLRVRTAQYRCIHYVK